MRPGGKGANAAVQIAALGVATHLIGRVGEDSNSALALSELERINADLSGVTRDGKRATGTAIAITPREVRVPFWFLLISLCQYLSLFARHTLTNNHNTCNRTLPKKSQFLTSAKTWN